MILWPPPQRVDFSPNAQPSRATLPPQGYRIVVRDGIAAVDAADDAGRRYARATLEQLGATDDVMIEDWPAIAVRGVMLDVSRCRAPSLDTLKNLLGTLASWKINHVELYLEHTFAYAGHEEVWRAASAYTAEELRLLDDHADSLGIELTGQQNCLGHMERWLKFDTYKPLAISPEGFTAPWGERREPSTADPDNPATLVLARDLFGQLLPNLRSRRAHVGLDEPWELSSERSGSWISYLRALRSAPELAGHHVLVWDDVLVHNSELLAQIPEDVTICDWGYEAAQPFDERAIELKAMGLPFWLCPGTSAWNTVAGRWTNAVTNIASACRAAVTNGAEGVLVTDWGDQGHIQHHVVSRPMFAWTAGCAWNPAAEPEDIVALVPSGEALRLLGDLHTLVKPQLFNTSILTVPMYRPEAKFGHGRMTRGITVEDLERCAAQAERARSLLTGADVGIDRDEALATAELMSILVANGVERVRTDGTLRAASTETLSTLRERTWGARAEHARIWNIRNRPGGLDESLANFDRLLSSYVPEHHDAAGP
ncbi:MAG TPA: family 20 glycosylhydrolase [Acidimicrobiales bacterium]|nr:family 20 glycosylhydrolase [Acidimicrobiales bacterium]